MKPQIDDTMTSPPGDWRYEQPETGVVLRAGNFRDLCRNIRVHRESNGLPAGTPAEDVHAYFCEKYPEICKIQQEVIEKTGLGVRDVQAFLATVTEIVTKRGADAFVDQAEMDRRAAICVSCPHNKTLGCVGCAGIAGLVFKAIGGKVSKYDGALRQCGVCGCSLQAKTALKIDLIRQTQAAAYVFPEHCWLAEK